MHKELENINRPLRGFVRRFYVSSLEEFSFCRERQYSYNETNTLKLRGNCERNFDGAFSSFLKTTFFSECLKSIIINSLFKRSRIGKKRKKIGWKPHLAPADRAAARNRSWHPCFYAPVPISGRSASKQV